MSQNPQNSEPAVVSEALQQPIQCEMRVTSSGLEVTITPETLQPAMACHCGCEGTSISEEQVYELKEERDTAIWVARKLLGMVSGNRREVITFRAILDSISPECQERAQDDTQDNTSRAARARSGASMKQISLLRREAGLAWRAYFMVVKLLKHTISDVAALEADTDAQISVHADRIAELETVITQLKRVLAVHENYNNPTRTGTIFAANRRNFRANERKKQAAASGGMKSDGNGAECDGNGAAPDSHASTCEPETCIECGRDKTCDICKMDADRPPVPADFGFDVDVSELIGQKEKVAGRRSPGHQPGAPGISHNRKPDPSLAVESKQDMCGVCLRTDVDLKTIYKTVIEAVSGAVIGNGLNAVSRISQAIEEIKQEKGAGMDQTRLSALLDVVLEKVIKMTSESIVCYTESITYAECHTCNVRTYPTDAHTIPGTTFGPNLREILFNLHRMTTAVRSLKYGLGSNHKALASTGAISKCLTAIAEYAEHGRIRKIPPPPDPPEPEDFLTEEPKEKQERPAVRTDPPEPEVLTGGAPIKGRGDMRDVPPCPVRTNLNTPPVLTQIIEMITMAPSVEFDESVSWVKGKKWQTLALGTTRAVLLKIKPSRSKATIEMEFYWIMKRPGTADMYRCGNALIGPFQTCIVHLDRKGESFAIRAKDGSWEYVLWKMSKKVFRYISDANKIIIALAGGADRTACDIGVALRKNPNLKKFVAAVEEHVWRKLDAIAEAYETVNLTLEDSHKMAVSLRNAAPFTCTSMYHPGMSCHTNNIERIIRQYSVRPRNTYRSLPNEQAATTLGILQTLHANAQLLDITSGEIISCRNGPRDLYHTGIPPPIFGGGTGERQDDAAT